MSEKGSSKLQIYISSLRVDKLPQTSYPNSVFPTQFKPIVSFTLNGESSKPPTLSSSSEGKLEEQKMNKTVSYDFFEKTIAKFVEIPVKPKYPPERNVNPAPYRLRVRVQIEAFSYEKDIDIRSLPHGMEVARVLRMKEVNHSFISLKLHFTMDEKIGWGVSKSLFTKGKYMEDLAAHIKLTDGFSMHGVLAFKGSMNSSKVSNCRVYNSIREAIEKELEANAKESNIAISLAVFQGAYHWKKPLRVPGAVKRLKLSIFAFKKSSIESVDSTQPCLIIDRNTRFTLSLNKVSFVASKMLQLPDAHQEKFVINANKSDIGSIYSGNAVLYPLKEYDNKVIERDTQRYRTATEVPDHDVSNCIGVIYRTDYQLYTERF